MTAIAATANVEQVLTEYPATVPIFLRRRMQCVGCPIARFETIADACRIYHFPVTGFVAELQQAASGRSG